MSRFPCTMCGLQATRRAQLTAHMRNVHRKVKKKEGKARIRRPLSAYLLYCNDERPHLEPWLSKQEARLELRWVLLLNLDQWPHQPWLTKQEARLVLRWVFVEY